MTWIEGFPEPCPALTAVTHPLMYCKTHIETHEELLATFYSYLLPIKYLPVL